MSTCRRSTLAGLVTACILSAALLAAQEPAPTSSPSQANTNPDAELRDARKSLAEQIDKSVEAKLVEVKLTEADAIEAGAEVDLAYVDLVSTLVAGNALGIDVAAPDAALRAQLGLIEGQGVVVTAVPEGSQGEKAGVKLHDVLLAIDGQGVGDAASLHKLLEASGGKEVHLMLRRGGEMVELKSKLSKPKTAELVLDDWITAKLENLEHYRIGVTLSEADDTLRAQVGLAAGEGLVVTEVLEGTAAAEAGLRVHDVLTMLAGKRLTTVDAVNAQIQEIKDKVVELRMLRGGKEVTLQIAPRKALVPAPSNKPVTVWETSDCKRCHQSSHQRANPHNLMGWRLGANTSVWTDGNHAKLFLYEKAFQTQLAGGGTPNANDREPAGPKRQIEALRAQLTEMQKTLEALQASLPQPAKPEEREDDKRD